MDPAALQAIELFTHYQKGHLWRSGGLAEQPHRYLRQMACVGSAMAELERDQLEQQRRGR